jgi:hypothetical protein
MIASLIFVISFVLLLQFFVWHCRSILAYNRTVELSDRVREVTGIVAEEVRASDFDRLLQLVRLCPERGEDQKQIRVVGAYYNLLALLDRLTRSLFPGVAAWAETERQNCSYFAAVALDRRISYSRDLFTQQVADRL